MVRVRYEKPEVGSWSEVEWPTEMLGAFKLDRYQLIKVSCFMDTISFEPPYASGLHHITFRTADFNASIAFFCEGFGIQRLMSWKRRDGSDGVILDCGNGGRIEIFGGEDASSLYDDQTLVHFALRTGDVERAHRRALAFGAKERTAPKSIEVDAEEGRISLTISFVTAPGGIVVEFFDGPF